MSKQNFDDQCPGCRPALVDAQTGKVMAHDSPQMKCVLAVWAETTRKEREAFHRFTCLNSREDGDMRIVKELSERFITAMEAIPEERKAQ